MTTVEFSEMIGRVFLYLGANRPSPAQLEAWHRDVKRIPAAAIPAIEELLKGRESISSKNNVPMIINQEYARLASNSSVPSMTVYDSIEDFRFPIVKMFHAYDILERGGEVEFARYCESVRMPRNDRERVRAKLRAVKAKTIPEDRAREIVGKMAESIPF